MNRHEFAGMCIRLLALFFVVTGLYQIPSLLLPWLKKGFIIAPSSFLLAGTTLKIVLPVGAGVLVWLGSGYLGRLIAEPSKEGEPGQDVIGVGSTDFLATALVVTGLVFFFASLKKLIYSFLTYTVETGPLQEVTYSIGTRVLPDDRLAQVTWVVICLLSVLVMLRARFLSRTLLD